MPELRPSDWARIEHALPVKRDWRQEPFDPTTPLEPLQLASRLDALAVHYRSEARRLQEEARDARERAQECRQWAANLQRTAAK